MSNNTPTSTTSFMSHTQLCVHVLVRYHSFVCLSFSGFGSRLLTEVLSLLMNRARQCRSFIWWVNNFTCLQYLSSLPFSFLSFPFPFSLSLSSSSLSHSLICPLFISLSLFLYLSLPHFSNLSSLVHSSKVGNTSSVQEHE